ncbi:alpha/beta hydrolase [Leptospira ryugenii]|uniref:Alpha/beta hydrolase n=1 Tax=Leptospira ryugenii TaxID=1917863 RepID=A0A2P2DXI6_9LEPT|nr:alpha/beta hydrolase [Leptospira ryugenii]
MVLSGGGARGAYQAGVFRALEERKWKPDIICGTSVGAINACAIGSGMKSQELINLWLDLNQGKVMRYSLNRIFTELFRKSYAPLADTTPLRKLLEQKLDFTKLNHSEIRVIISAVNILSAELEFFRNPDLKKEHILASSAIPLFFPWSLVNGTPYWDGGVMANTPILPAITEGAEEILVILLSPVGRDTRMLLPKNKTEALERLYELYLLGSYKNIEQGIEFQKELSQPKSAIEYFLRSFQIKFENIKIKTIAPREFLGLGSFLNFKKEQARDLIARGYQDASDFFVQEH